jgi:hypothetical protein
MARADTGGRTTAEHGHQTSTSRYSHFCTTNIVPVMLKSRLDHVNDQPLYCASSRDIAVRVDREVWGKMIMGDVTAVKHYDDL